MLEAKLLVHWILTDVLVVVKLLNLSHQLILILVFQLVLIVLHVVKLSSNFIFLIGFILLTNFLAQIIKNLIDSSFEPVSA